MAGLLAIYNCYKAAGFTMSKTLAIVFRVHLLAYCSATSRYNELSLNTNLVAVAGDAPVLLVMSQSWHFSTTPQYFKLKEQSWDNSIATITWEVSTRLLIKFKDYVVAFFPNELRTRGSLASQPRLFCEQHNQLYLKQLPRTTQYVERVDRPLLLTHSYSAVTSVKVVSFTQ